MFFFDNFFMRFTPCRIEARQITYEEIVARCLNVSYTYGKIGLVNPFSLYKKVIDGLDSYQRVEFRPLARLMEPVKDRIALALRHDLDADVVTGLRAASFLASRGLPGSFYLLHSSHYYGEIENNTFFRYSALSSFVQQFVATGCELGLHSDPLHFYSNHGIDGLQAVKSELKWLRSCGAVIKGTVAHNSAVVYGGENFEIFRGKSVANRTVLECGGQSIPLQLVDEHQIGLTYEGNYPVLKDLLDADKAEEFIRLAENDGVRHKKWLELYFLHNPFFDRQYDVDIWLLGEDAWAVALRGENKKLFWPVSTNSMLALISDIDLGARVVVNIHPEYVSGGDV